MHRIARQSVELRVDTDAAAYELYAELSASFQARMAPVLDEVFTAACPPQVTVRVDRLEIDVGTVPREGLMDAVAVAVREQLAELLTAPANVAGPSGSRSMRRLSMEEIALERLAAFLEYGTTTWRDANVTREALEATLLELTESAPAALRRMLERLPPARVARRIRMQLTVLARHRLLAWLGVADPAELDRALADWTAVLAALEGISDSRPGGALSSPTAAWLLEQVWGLVLARRRVDAAAGAIGERVLATLTSGASAADSALRLEIVLVTAARLLPRDSAVWHFIADSAAQIDLERRRDAHGRPMATGPEAKPGRGDAGAAGTYDKGARGPSQGAEGRDDGRRTPARGGLQNEVGHEESEGVRARRRASAADPRVDPDVIDGARRRAVSQLKEASRLEPSTRRDHVTFGTEPLWVAHAGAVIVWPFLPGFFEACGLTAAKRFVDDAARERAVLLTAHLANGLREWGEHDLLLEKTLCGYPGDEPIASAIELLDSEQQQANELLESLIGHWKALKSTSVDGVRRAFLCRAGTMTGIASGWKLEIPRAGHDVLLDTLPWGIGLVLLPWMEQPLHVEW